jgi:hypothetical protein
MAALVREACVIALKESLQQAAAAGAGAGGTPQVLMRHFGAALRCVVPSVSRKDQKVGCAAGSSGAAAWGCCLGLAAWLGWFGAAVGWQWCWGAWGGC